MPFNEKQLIKQRRVERKQHLERIKRDLLIKYPRKPELPTTDNDGEPKRA